MGVSPPNWWYFGSHIGKIWDESLIKLQEGQPKNPEYTGKNCDKLKVSLSVSGPSLKVPCLNISHYNEINPSIWLLHSFYFTVLPGLRVIMGSLCLFFVFIFFFTFFFLACTALTLLLLCWFPLIIVLLQIFLHKCQWNGKL